MEFNFHTVNLKKKFPLQISRGVHDRSQNLFVEFIKDGITAWGECAPGKTEGATSAEEVEKHLKRLIDSNIETPDNEFKTNVTPFPLVIFITSSYLF